MLWLISISCCGKIAAELRIYRETPFSRCRMGTLRRSRYAAPGQLGELRLRTSVRTSPMEWGTLSMSQRNTPSRSLAERALRHLYSSNPRIPYEGSCQGIARQARCIMSKKGKALKGHHVAGAGGAVAGQDLEPHLAQRVVAVVADHVDPAVGGSRETSPRHGETGVQSLAAPVG